MIRRSPPFTLEMRDAIRTGKKTQTRRIVKLSDPTETYACYGDDGWPETVDHYGKWRRDRAPYGQPGDIWAMAEPLRRSGSGMVVYAEDGTPVWVDGLETTSWRWKRDNLTSMQMPTAYARTYRLITDVRAERLQDVSEADALAESVPGPGFLNATDSFRSLWDSIYLKDGHGWDANDWVFVYTWRDATADEVERHENRGRRREGGN